MRWLLTLLLLLSFPEMLLAQEEEYSFDLSEIEIKPYHIGGYVELRPVLFGLDRDSSSHKLKFYDHGEGHTLDVYNLTFQLDASYEKGITGLYLKTNTDLKQSDVESSEETELYEGYLSIEPSPSLTLEVGKKTLKWGKGYAWNPVAFVDRPKNPNDPELAMEGFVVFTFEYIKSFSGALKTLSISPLILPVNESINSEFGDQSQLIFGGKIYLLLNNTDIDFMILSGKHFADRFGIDFSRNISSNIEVHGEVSYIPDLKQSERVSYLLGLRFLTKSDITFIFEYYKNGRGLSSDEIAKYYLDIDEAYKTYLQTGDETAIELLQDTTDPVFRSFASMSDYLYLRISQKEPFDILYLLPSITTIYNLIDHSFSITPELIYTPVTNLELRAKISLFSGVSGSDFGEKQNKFRLEFRGRYYF
ncbi:MAG: hypothetical protein KAS97_10560 [Candidatus Aminicenantes bacterium]|nr:hypothetical protein [Candidatus Aminicenantes bacterium]